MPQHFAAFYDSNIDGTSGYAKLQVQADALLGADTTNKVYKPNRDLSILAAVAAGPNIKNAQLVAPNLLRGAYPHVVPLQDAVTVSFRPHVADFLDRPPRLLGGESVSVQVKNTAAGKTYAGLVLGFDMVPPPPGESLWIPYSTANFNTGVSTDGVWTKANTTGIVTLAADLPAGAWAIIGMDHWGSNTMAARWILPGYRYRPGVVAHLTAAASEGHQLFLDGRMGVMGYFSSEQFPTLEILPEASSTATTAAGWLRIIRIGDVGALPAMGR